MSNIVPFPNRGPFVVRIERERDGDGWLVLARSHGWLHGDHNTALADAHSVADGFGVSVRSSARRNV
jgi:hypothetical protein